jgi:dolichyl-phosphate-mannose-protein mannosyltransferase
MSRRIIFLLAIAALIFSFAGTAYAEPVSHATPSQTTAATSLTLIVSCIFIIASVTLAMRRFAVEDKYGWSLFFLAAAAAIAVRVYIAAVYPGYGVDMNCFSSWAETVYSRGPSGFYSSLGFADYPPGYIYILWVLGFLRNLFGFGIGSVENTVLLKLPAIISEVIIAVIVYRIASKEAGRKFGLLCSLLILFNPALFFNGSVWGQIDPVFALFIVLSLYWLKKENYLAGAFFFAIALLIKPQAIMFAPVVGLAYVYALFKRGGLKKALTGIFGGLAIIAAVIFLGALPFTGNQPAFWIVDKYAGTVGSYPYGTLNAFNLFALLGGNWTPDTTTLLLYDYRTWGMIFLVIICAAVAFLQWKTRERRPYFDIAAFLIISLFMLMHMVHERYIVPACVLLIFAYVYSRDTSALVFAGAWSVSAMFNQLVVLYADSTAAPEGPLMVLSAINAALYAVYAALTVKKLLSRKVLIKSPALHG